MKVSLNPTYFCNFDCSFCYLTKSQLRDQKVIPTKVLEARLKELAKYEKITHVDLYGGEIGLLTKDQWDDIKNEIRRVYAGPINIITNLSRIHPGFLDPDVYVTVSYDFDVRQASASVRNNMFMLEQEFSILILASKDMLDRDVDMMIHELNLFSNLVSVEIKPYSTNQANADDVSFSDFEEFVKRWIDSDVEMKFDFMNEYQIMDAIEGENNSFSDDHIYITPNGKFGVLEFDANDNEFFLELDSIDEYISWTKTEKARVESNDFCNGCEYLGNCLSEHLRDVKDLSNSCNGFKNLLDWFKNERMEV